MNGHWNDLTKCCRRTLGRHIPTVVGEATARCWVEGEGCAGGAAERSGGGRAGGQVSASPEPNLRLEEAGARWEQLYIPEGVGQHTQRRSAVLPLGECRSSWTVLEIIWLVALFTVLGLFSWLH